MSSITIRLIGFAEGQKMFHDSARRYNKVVTQSLQEYGDDAVKWLKRNILGDDLGLAPKKRDNGEPPLVDSHKYAEGFKATVTGSEMGIRSEGDNDFMPNEDLTDLLEYGFGEVPARPHIRPLFNYMKSKAPKVGERIFNRLFNGAK